MVNAEKKESVLKKIKVSDYIADFLQFQEVSHVFEMAGGMIAHLLDSFYRRKSVTIISMHHEQSAAFAVDAYGRVVGKPSVALATSGPGATNLLTGIASCYFDSSPALFITGQVNTHEQKGTKNIRQLGFQETDIVSMSQFITKKSFRVESADEVVSILEEAYQLTISDRQGPVLIDIPMNIQAMEIEIPSYKKIISKKINLQENSKKNIELLFSTLKQAKRPLVLAGGGINSARAKKDFLKLIESIGVPVVSSLMGLDTISYDHPLRVGFIGSYGNRWANMSLAQSDCLLVLGSRLDIRQTGADTQAFSSNKKIFHVDCDENELNNRLQDCMTILSDLNYFFDYVREKFLNFTLPNYHDWKEEIFRLKNSYPDRQELSNFSGINPNVFFHAVAHASKQAAGYVVDVGSHQMWAAQSLEVSDEQFFITSGGLGAMGFSLPAAIGACLVLKRPLVVIVGDGSLQVNIQELQTVVRNKIPLKIILINNKSLGMITQFQDSYFEGRYQSTHWGYSAPDFLAVSQGYKIASKSIACIDEMTLALDWLWQDAESPCLLEVMIQSHLPVYPKIVFGRPISDMEPFVEPNSLNSL